jgi:hypothetical protein
LLAVSPKWLRKVVISDTAGLVRPTMAMATPVPLMLEL